MSQTGEKHRYWLAPLLVVLASVAARWSFLSIVPNDAVSIDLRSWLKVAQELAAGANPYTTTTYLNWPPLWLQTVFGLDTASQFLAIPLFRVIQAFLICVEILVILVVFRLLRHVEIRGHSSTIVLLGIALNPVCILQVCQHGNFDVLVGLWVAAAVLMLLRFEDSGRNTDWLFACLFVGLGTLTKTVPIVLLPVLISRFRRVDLHTRLLGAVLVFLPAALGLSIVYALDPGGITHKVLMYRSAPACFGLTGLLTIWGADRVVAAYGTGFAIAFSAGLALACGLAAWRPPATGARHSLCGLAALCLMIVPALGPGYAPQYVYWFLPLLVVLSGVADGPVRILVRSFLVVAAVTYSVEYALNPDLGAFLVKMAGSDTVLNLAAAMRTPAAQTLVRLPLFGAFLAVIWILSARGIAVRPSR